MRHLLFIFLITSLGGMAQSYSSPESIEFDPVNNRWLISNNGDGKILSRSSVSGALSVFASGISSGPHGLEIVNDTLYVCDGATLKGYNVHTGGSPLFSINMGANFLNGITHDADNLYITDFTAKKIYRYTIATRQFNVFVTGLAKSPNGIIYDAAGDRCVFVNWGTNAPVMELDLSDSTTSIITATTLSNCDGIARDAAGNYFVSSWGLQGISKFNSSFSGGPVTVVSGLSNPADIYYNQLTDTLAVPNSGSSGANGNKATFHYMGTSTGIESASAEANALIYPNPANDKVNIQMNVKGAALILISVFSLDGKLMKQTTKSSSGSGLINVTLDSGDLPEGAYFIETTVNDEKTRKKIIIAH